MSTLVMGVVNVTTDSFSDGGRYLDTGAAISHGLALWAAGADILDVGGESTRPGAERVDPSIERDRVVPVIRALAQRGAWISIDTMNASTALAAVDSGARIVNDVSGGLADAAMLPAVAETDAEIILGHWRGPSREMYAPAQYADVAAEVTAELAERVAAARDAGIGADRIIVDPGIGFGKRPEQNWEVLRALPQLVAAGQRVLLGTSRKRFLAEALAEASVDAERRFTQRTGAAATRAGGEDPSGDTVGAVTEGRRDGATAVTSALAARAGVWGVRVHDVAATRDALRVAELWGGSDAAAR
ncbi:dihydropteroate synthase [Microbacterium sp. UBA837]|jgi:dihydropteroate synthase|uniref:dihydropteroate synthase n=1 Tax=Microbacterium sp. UBA837 TaxID=1946956 RepID=UPI000ECC87F9|nr:dihydropteroate synthase [Microbacterium sp. UBA837]MEC8762992.1 dihydropteroate synthase [Actinomycetota bacterium]HCM49937.1 dihydropteroate synthase [Microbacterium sp.]HCU78608.1 dihydropteroate synthase [Microbacterium sp.]